MELITAKFSAPTLCLFPHGKIDTNNALQAEQEIQGFCQDYPAQSVLMDMEDLSYISSAGLRVLLRLRKEQPSLRLVGVSSEVYEILEMTGFSEIIPCEKAYRRFSVDGCEIIGKGAKGTVYRLDAETIIKVYEDADALPAIRRGRELARTAFVLGIPTAISYDVARVGDSYGSVFELLEAKSYSQLIREAPEQLPHYVENCAELLRQLHSTEVQNTDLPDGKPLLYKWLNECRPFLDEGDNVRLQELVDGLPSPLYMLHGDFHTNNIMQQTGETLLIDMDTLCYGHPIIELANIYVAYVGLAEADPRLVEDFLGLPIELARRFWQLFLPCYLESSDPDRINDVQTKVRLLSYARLLRHFARRGLNSDAQQKFAVHCADTIHTLLPKVAALEF